MARKPRQPTLVRETPPAYSVDVGDRGRLVLPAPLRRQLAIKTGDRMTLTIESDGSLRLLRRADLAARLRGVYRDVDPGRSWADDLMAERRREAAHDDAE